LLAKKLGIWKKMLYICTLFHFTHSSWIECKSEAGAVIRDVILVAPDKESGLLDIGLIGILCD